MQHLRLLVVLIAGLLLSGAAAHAQSAGAVTATCKDGTSFTGTKRSGACRGHGGVEAWGTASEPGGLVTPAVEPAAAPASGKSATQAQGTGTVMATCKDGTSFTGAKRAGACRGHGGVQAWGAAPEPGGLVTPAVEPAAASAGKGTAQAQGAVTVMATCKDGTSFTGTKRSGSCRGQGGVPAPGRLVPVNEVPPLQVAMPVAAPCAWAVPLPAEAAAGSTAGVTRPPGSGAAR